jgi:dolichol-phosphate mannosyltransferase
MKMAVVVLPTYDERENVSPVIDRIISVRDAVRPIDLHVLFVDDSSPDGTGDVIRKLMERHDFIHLLTRKEKLGLGTAYSDGFRYSLEALGASIVLEMDSDLQHPPEKIPELIKTVEDGYDLVIASRYIKGGGQKGWSRRRVIISKGANWLARFVLQLKVKDVTSGFRAMNARAAIELVNSALSASGFSFQLEAIKVLKDKGMKTTEIPFVFEARAYGKSKLSGSEITRFAKTVFRLRFR